MSGLLGQENNVGGSAPISSEALAVAKRHSEFYLEDPLVVLLIEDTLFKVHKHQLTKFEAFSDMFKTVQPASGGPEEGSSAETPIVLQGVKASEFECLMKILYATYNISSSNFSAHRPIPEPSLLLPAFRLAHMWNFEDLCTYLLPFIQEHLNDVDKIVFAREFEIKEWLAPAHINLCQRLEPPTTDEAVKLGIHSLLLISRLREQYFRSATPEGTWVCAPCIGYTYYSFSGTCSKCNSVPGSYLLRSSLRACGPTDVSIKQAVERWVANGCTFGS
ncbi:hypothetical protein FS749_011579 [Ceratobasidium sp. UAMH 11750]|nr:hypothetical protein FS749_011579 [Ceratobasidium sp. UAMH 11750]